MKHFKMWGAKHEMKNRLHCRFKEPGVQSFLKYMFTRFLKVASRNQESEKVLLSA